MSWIHVVDLMHLLLSPHTTGKLLSDSQGKMRRIALLNAVLALHTVQGFIVPSNLVPQQRRRMEGQGEGVVAAAEETTRGRRSWRMMSSKAPFATPDELKDDKGLKVSAASFVCHNASASPQTFDLFINHPFSHIP